MDFVHLHTHSHYSLLDGAIKLDKLISKVKELGMHSIALTDHGNLYGAYEFFKLAKAQKIKSIIGCEYYVAVGSMRDRFINQEDKKNYRHLTVLAKNNVGYQNLIKLSTLSFTEGFYSKPRVDKNLLSQCSEGLIALSGCISGDIPAYLLQDRVTEAKKTYT